MRTGIFIGGKNAVLALAMLEAAKEALVPPFQLSVFADPAGSFTTGAAMVACVERVLKEKKQRDLKGLQGGDLRRDRRGRLLRRRDLRAQKARR